MSSKYTTTQSKYSNTVSRRRFRKARTRYRRKLGKWRKMGRKANNSSMWNIAKATVKKFLNPEYKFDDNNSGGININDVDNATIYSPGVGISRGTSSDSERVGMSIKLTNFYMRGHMSWQSGGDAVQTVRLIILTDKQTNGALFSMSDLLADPTAGPVSIHSLKSLDRTRRFKIHYDKIFVLQQYNPVVPFDINLALATHLDYSGDADDITDLNERSFHIVIFSSQSTSNYPDMSMMYRLRYLDN